MAHDLKDSAQVLAFEPARRHAQRKPPRGSVEWLESLLTRPVKASAAITAPVTETVVPPPQTVPPAPAIIPKALPAVSPAPGRRPAIRDWPADDRPRERLIKFGPQALSDSDLLAILIRTGDARRGQNAMEQARELLRSAGSLMALARMSAADLQKIAGLGPAKAAQVLAALALAPRLDRALLGERPQVSGSETAFKLLREQYTNPALEEIVTLLLDTKNRLLRVVRCAQGGVGNVSIDPAALFREAVREGAAAIVLSHNHPSGDPSPSEADRRFTADAVAAGKMLSVRVLDHIVVAGVRYYSFLDEGLLG